jgi:hypothetical protein
MQIKTEFQKDYEVSLSPDRKYIVVNIKTDMTNELGYRCGVDAAELGLQSDIKCYLFDLRGAPNIESTLENYTFAYDEMNDFRFPKDARSALLTDPDDRSHDFMETVFNNAGYAVRLFTDEAAAIAWLSG